MFLFSFAIFFFTKITCPLCRRAHVPQDTKSETYRKSSFFLLKEALLLTLPRFIRVTPRKTRGHNLGHAVRNHPEQLCLIDSELPNSCFSDGPELLKQWDQTKQHRSRGEKMQVELNSLYNWVNRKEDCKPQLREGHKMETKKSYEGEEQKKRWPVNSDTILGISNMICREMENTAV